MEKIFLTKCIERILCQSYIHLEIILNDNGASEICDDYSNHYENIIVVHKDHGGICITRNVGLDIAKGKYICFCDDDVYLDNVLQYLYDLMDDDIDYTSCECTTIDINNRMCCEKKKYKPIETIDHDDLLM